MKTMSTIGVGLILLGLPVNTSFDDWRETAQARKQERLRYREAGWLYRIFDFETQLPKSPPPTEAKIQRPPDPPKVREEPLEIQEDPIPPDPPKEVKVEPPLGSLENPINPDDFDPKAFPELKPYPYEFNVLPFSRDQISSFDSKAKTHNYISLDFDAVFKKSQALVVVPNGTKKDSPLGKAALAYVQEVKRVYGKEHGITIRYGGNTFGKWSGVRTRKENRRGYANVTHVEGFDSLDDSMMQEIKDHPEIYAGILARTFGKLGKNTTFIAPHTKKSQGAYWKGISERRFALSYTIPKLQRIKADLHGRVLTFDLSSKTARLAQHGKTVWSFSGVEWSRNGRSKMENGIGGKPGSYDTPVGKEFFYTKEPWHSYGKVFRVQGLSEDGYLQNNRGILIHRDNTRDGYSNGCLHVGSSTSMAKLFDLAPSGTRLVIKR